MHLLAATVLLNSTLAFRAFLRVALDPVRCLAVVLALLKPEPRYLANHGPVVSFSLATKTERMLRRTLDSWDNSVHGAP